MKKGKRAMRLEVIQNGRVIPKAEAKAVLIDASRAFRERQDRSRMERRVARLEAAPERLIAPQYVTPTEAAQILREVGLRK